MKEFKPVNIKEWEDKAIQDLKSEEAFRNLIKTWNGLTLNPYYDQAAVPQSASDFQGHFANGDPINSRARSWYNIVRIHVDNEKKANAEALSVLMNGAEGIHFIIEEACDINVLLQDILPEYIYLVFTISDEEVADGIREWLDRQDEEPADINVYIASRIQESDPVRLIELFDAWPGVRFLHFNIKYESGTPADDFCNVLMQVSETFEKLTAGGISPTLIARELTFSISMGPEFFKEIIRMRALRILVYKVCRAWGAELEPEDIVIHAISEPWINEDFQPQGNMIKSATSAMAGILGGANLLTVLPEDGENELQKRIARNVSIILKNESFLDRTRDTVAGSYYIETLTDELGRMVWSQFQKQNES